MVNMNFLVTCMKILVTQKIEIIVFQFLVKCIKCLISNKILFGILLNILNFLW